MRLQAVAKRFNNMSCLDAYSGQLAFMGQLDLFDGNKRDSVTAERRIISVAPGTELPPRRAVLADGRYYILGAEQPDSFNGNVIRIGVVAHDAPYLATIRSLSETCLAAGGTQARTNLVWIKNLAYSEQSSDLTPEYQIFFAAGEPVQEGAVIHVNSVAYLVRAVDAGASGLTIAIAEQVQEPWREEVTLHAGSYNPVTQQRAASNILCPMVRLRWQSIFRYRSQTTPKFGPDDAQMVVAKTSATPAVGATFSGFGGDWLVSSVDSRDDVWLLKATRHG